MKIISNFVVFEGSDGSGTTTQLSMLCERLKNSGKPVLFPTFEPTDGQIGKLIRLSLKKEVVLEAETLAFLFSADRNEHLNGKGGIIEQINSGCLVVSDRYVLSSLVYQGIECGDELPLMLNKSFGIPEITILFDIDTEIALSRMKERSSLEIYEYREFQEKVREKYKIAADIYREKGARIEIIDASHSVKEVSDKVWSIVSSMPIFNKQ